MNIISLPTELSNLKIDDSNIEHLLYKLSYFYAPDCLSKDPSKNRALDFVRKFGGIGDENDSIYEKFIPISKANMVEEREDLGFTFDVMDYDYPDYYVASEIVYQKWREALNFEQKLDYKMLSLIQLHDVEVGRISNLADDCDTLDFTVRAEHQLSLMNQIWDSNFYAIYDDNIVWGVGYSEVGAFFSSLENHLWLELHTQDDKSPAGLEETTPYPKSHELFTKILQLIMSKNSDWQLGENLMMRPCTKRVHKLVSIEGLTEFNFCEKNGYLDIAE